MIKLSQAVTNATETVQKVTQKLQQAQELTNRLLSIKEDTEVLPGIKVLAEKIDGMNGSVANALKQSNEGMIEVISTSAVNKFIEEASALQNDLSSSITSVSTMAKTLEDEQYEKNLGYKRSISDLNEEIKTASMDVDDTLEDVDTRQSRLSREIRAFVTGFSFSLVPLSYSPLLL